MLRGKGWGPGRMQLAHSEAGPGRTEPPARGAPERPGPATAGTHTARQRPLPGGACGLRLTWGRGEAPGMRRSKPGRGRALCGPHVRAAGAAGARVAGCGLAPAPLQSPGRRLPRGSPLVGAAAAELGWPRGPRGHGVHSGEVPEVGEAPGGHGPLAGVGRLSPRGGACAGCAAPRGAPEGRDSGCGCSQPGGGPSRGRGAL